MRGEAQDAHTGRDWTARPVLARSIGAAGVGFPIVLAIATGLATGRIFGRPDSFGLALVRVLTTAAVSAVVLKAADRVFRRLAPLAAMYHLTLVFPDHAPSRFAMALRSGNSKLLERRIADIREGRTIAVDEQSYYETLLELTAALNRHDRLTRGHCERTRAYTDVIIAELELPKHDADRLRWASLLHDVGKLGVDAEILNKPDKPTDAEWIQLRAHPDMGAELAAPIAGFLGPWMSAISQHHERWDGGGYPAGLAGREIHLGGRIVAVADAYDVMTSARSYKRPMSPREARRELLSCAGSQFDPEIVRAFLATSLGRARWSYASLGSLIHLKEALALLAPAPVVGMASAAGAVALTTGAMAGLGAIDSLTPLPASPPAAVVEGDAGPAPDVDPTALTALDHGDRTSTSATADRADRDASSGRESAPGREREVGREPGNGSETGTGSEPGNGSAQQPGGASQPTSSTVPDPETQTPPTSGSPPTTQQPQSPSTTSGPAAPQGPPTTRAPSRTGSPPTTEGQESAVQDGDAQQPGSGSAGNGGGGSGR